jgi:2,5-diamino-6-(ribosylamino)-4(3H)-pyrimidinone 5'-phosphate reductase
LSAHLKGKEEKILKILEALKEESAKGTPIIVEGKNDIETLRTLGIEGKITSAKTGGKSFLDLVSEMEKTNAQETILLLDFDRRGKQLTKKLKQHMDKTGMKLNINFWLELLALLSKEVKDVEGLASYMETLKRKTSNS